MKKIPEALKVPLKRSKDNGTLKENFRECVRASFGFLTQPTYASKKLEGIQGSLSGEPLEQFNLSFNLVLLMTSEFLRKSFTIVEIESELAEIGFDETCSKTFLSLYGDLSQLISSEDGELIRNLSLNTSISFPKLIDLKWKYEFNLHNSESLKTSTDVYLLELTYIEKDWTIRTIPFRCTYPQLQELGFTISSACTAIQKTKV